MGLQEAQLPDARKHRRCVRGGGGVGHGKCPLAVLQPHTGRAAPRDAENVRRTCCKCTCRKGCILHTGRYMRHTCMHRISAVHLTTGRRPTHMRWALLSCAARSDGVLAVLVAWGVDRHGGHAGRCNGGLGCGRHERRRGRQHHRSARKGRDTGAFLCRGRTALMPFTAGVPAA